MELIKSVVDCIIYKIVNVFKFIRTYIVVDNQKEKIKKTKIENFEVYS